MQLSGSFYVLAIFCASALGATLNPRQTRLAIRLYEATNYHGTPNSVSFIEAACTQLPTLQFESIRIPEDYDCSFYANSDCNGDPDIDAFDSIPDIREYTNVALQSFKCDATE